LKQKAQANLAAIRTLKTIEAENRQATPEEKGVLVKYTGWGAMPNAFSAEPPRDWQAVANELRDALTAEEYTSARASTPNAHYTSPEVIQAIWQAMERFGLQPGAQILEPSVGVGHFFGLMPEGLHAGTRRTGVELDSVTAHIAAKLYPDSTVHGKRRRLKCLRSAVSGVTLKGKNVAALIAIPYYEADGRTAYLRSKGVRPPRH